MPLDFIRMQWLVSICGLELLHMLGQGLSMHLQRTQMRRFLPLVLGPLFCALTVSQITRALSAITISRTAGVAAHYQKLTGYTVEEVGNKPINIAASSGYLTFSLPIVARERDLAATSMFSKVDLTEWHSKCLFHRRTPARSSDDSY